ncbi:S8 family serine peptidase, partial [Candidatus Gracilibacteria bacterium]|nr:S8 family serine peptidase [Candidatus Gracilibacteria bacterium]
MKRWLTSLAIIIVSATTLVSYSIEISHSRLIHAQESLLPDHTAQELLISSDAISSDVLKSQLRSLQKDFAIDEIERLPTSETQFRVRFRDNTNLADIIANTTHQLKVEPNYLLQAEALPTDQYYASEQWYLNNTGQSFHRNGSTTQAGTAGIDINWQTSFSNSAERGEGTIVAIIDSGIVDLHSELTSQLWTNPSELNDSIDNDNNGLVDDTHGWNFFDNTNKLTDGLGHGTQAAGLIAANGNTQGIIGVAPQTKIMVLKVLDDNGNGSTSDVVQAIHYAVNQGANVINMSFGGANAMTAPLISACNDALQAGVVLVAAAGNSNLDIVAHNFAPAAVPGVIVAAASDSNGQRASFSNYGNKVDLTAPGIALLTTRAGTNSEPSSQVIGSTSNPNGYIVVTGTSFSAPLVSGAAALLKGQNPQWTVDQIRTRLQNSSTDMGSVGKDPLFGYGRLNVEAALGIVLTPPTNQAPIVATPTLSKSSILNNATDSTVLTITATDPEDQALTINGSGSIFANITFTQPTPNTFVSTALTTNAAAGSYPITIAVSDGTTSTITSISLTVVDTPAILDIIQPTSEQSFTTTATALSLSGQASNVHHILINNLALTTFIAGGDEWEITVPLSIGTNTFNVEGYASDNRLIIADSLIITRTAPAPTPEPSPSPTPTPTPTPDPLPTITESPAPIITPEPQPTASEEPVTPRRTKKSSRRSILDYLPLETTIIPASQATFPDVPTTHFAFTQVSDLAVKGSVSGHNGLFHPNYHVSRGEFLKIALRDAGLVSTTCSTQPSPFTDTTTSSFAAEINCAYAFGLLSP